MARRRRTLMPPGSSAPTGGKSGIEQLHVEQFARKLHQLMIEKGFRTNSELAAKIWGRTVTKEGHSAARNRDRIGCYLSGTSYPDPENLQKLADALGVEIKELAPDVLASTIDRENPELSITAVAGHADKVHLRVHKLVPMQVAARVMALLTEAETGEKI